MNDRNKWLSAYLPLMLTLAPNMLDTKRETDVSKKPKKCLLKGCNNMTIHNGGYCCAEHCKEDNL